MKVRARKRLLKGENRVFMNYERVEVPMIFQFYDPDKFINYIKLQTFRFNLYS